MAVPAPTGSDDSWFRLGLTFMLVLANGFFVCAEFAFVGARRSRLQQLGDAGDRKARRALSVLDDLDRMIAGTQVGITLASLALGWIGEPALADLIDGGLRRLGVSAPSAVVHSTSAVVTAFVIITYLHLVIGEVIPKSVALRAPETLARWMAAPLIVFSKLTAPVVWVIDRSSTGLLRLAGVADGRAMQHVHSPEELRLLVMQARAQGTLDESDSAMLAGVFDFHEKKARDVMRPRTDVVGIPLTATEDEAWTLVKRERYSRYPVFTGTLDDVVGVLLAKDLFLRDETQPWSLELMMRPPLLIPDTRPAERVLDDLRRTRAHLAVVLDEYGGMAGIVTMEDLVEEVVGDIADEYDQATRDSLELDGVLELAGSLSLVDARSDHRLAIPEGEWATIAGFTFSALGRLPRVGDRVSFPGGELEVVAMDGRRVAALRVHRTRAGGSA